MFGKRKLQSCAQSLFLKQTKSCTMNKFFHWSNIEKVFNIRSWLFSYTSQVFIIFHLYSCCDSISYCCPWAIMPLSAFYCWPNIHFMLLVGYTHCDSNEDEWTIFPIFILLIGILWLPLTYGIFNIKASCIDSLVKDE